MSNLSTKEELDFCYLLALLPALTNIPEYAALPELFSIVGHTALIDLCKYAGGESIRIPTLEELQHSIESLKWYYTVFVEKTSSLTDIPLEFKATAIEIFRQSLFED